MREAYGLAILFIFFSLPAFCLCQQGFIEAAESSHVRIGSPFSIEPVVPDWNKTYGDIGIESMGALLNTGDEGYLMAGTKWNYAANEADFWVVKTDTTGNMQWNKTYDSRGIDRAYSAVQTSDGGSIVVGSTQYPGSGDGAWLVKIDQFGNHQWNKTFGASNGKSVLQTSDGGYLITGWTSLGAGEGDVWLSKTDSTGNLQWNRTYGGTQSDGAESVVSTADGGFAIIGHTWSYGTGLSEDFWLIKVDSAGNEQWNRTFGGTGTERAYSAVQTSDGGYAIAGETSSFGKGESDVWLVKTSPEGNEQWSMTYGGINYDGAYSITETGNEGYVIAGYSNSYGIGETDAWVIKTDLRGNMQWNNTYGGIKRDLARCIEQTADEGYLVAGETKSFGAGESDLWLIKLPSVQAEQSPIDIVPYIIAGVALIITVSLLAFFLMTRRKGRIH